MALQVLIPGSGRELLRAELAAAFQAAGCRARVVDPAALHDPEGEQRLAALLASGRSLLLSVNFQGLTPLRPTMEQVRAAGGQVAVWCVDNPWNLLAAARDPSWRQAPLFVTDASFIGPLRAHGAERVFHLPLAADPALFSPNKEREARFPAPNDLAPFVFVGRSAFPGKAAFFAGQALPDHLLDRARAELGRGVRPDLLWWQEALGETGPFWPGKKARRPALGAEESNLIWRSLCLRYASEAGAAQAGSPETGAIGIGGSEAGPPGAMASEAPPSEAKTVNAAGAGALPAQARPVLGNGKKLVGLDLFGDAGWHGRLPPHARLRPPVDYYARLPAIYSTARFNLCLTSLQLPQGLNQRHFDVWMAGGVCLTDATPGLGLFPPELTRPVTFTGPEDIRRVAERAEGMRTSLISDWHGHILERHTYAHRVAAILEALGLDG